MAVFVLIFNAGTDNEGIHSILVGNRNTIMMFESQDDATRFALMLEAQDFPMAKVEEMDQQEIEEFCRQYGFDWQFVPEDSTVLITPPQKNVEKTDWEQGNSSKKTKEEQQEISNSELDSIRRRLEGLL
ncbi:DUF3110 domain-containing protein [Cylindrospermopsis raciborskii]|uniref:DUF3110 domain-containing protein n=1 Tax=Cylindrospermopsis raciborskii CENA302 TaxID=1170768 RepID=A0A9Q5QVZ6_9CYAN|nr:DUF3110 domain-containing protein [Cylindrospermopsis raciborskii]MCZ2202650.1 DUF3110 domain-containing protein [Cylindrospermopsis raciborskii PAMP2012]MCZ2206669.1 DUF3110 domain-containing protein [Cylindrospermopsis raciborskii PAMP2011]NLQ04531.1 DUF3110 domain-containing protein [Cylindrospermopsis raciborskii MVCC19]OHY34869.1 hypothetical protein BCV64_04400 [Cylindrospermopsis raciborskii MVCC14]OPH09244.1 hypothetical protein CENA302_11345 [Cylindrospermopsis raciborskii CENA302]